MCNRSFTKNCGVMAGTVFEVCNVRANCSWLGEALHQRFSRIGMILPR